MPASSPHARFKARVSRPARPGSGDPWCFVVLPKASSDLLPRRGRTSIEGRLNGQAFQATLEPDGQLSHWLKLDAALCRAAGVKAGDEVSVEFAALAREPEPLLPAELEAALAANPQARATWEATTTLARVDWIHWIDSAKQASTRAKRVHGACDRLAGGKKRVCCFDSSGHYDKSLSAPETAD